MTGRYYAKLQQLPSPPAPSRSVDSPTDSKANRISGIVLATWGHKEDGWCVTKLRVGKKTQILVGVAPALSQGDFIEAFGAYRQHTKFGWQFKATRIALRLMADEDAIKTWLGEKLPWVGAVRADAILKQFGTALWAILDNDPEKLLEIDGITDARLKQIIEAVESTRAERDLETHLIECGLSPKEAGRVATAWGDAAVERVKESPYDLYWVLHLPARTVEEVASRLDIPGDNLGRIEFLATILLERSLNDGHCYGLTHTVAADIASTYGRITLADAKAVLATSERFFFDDKRMYLWRIARAEQAIADAAVFEGAAQTPAQVLDWEGATEDQSKALDLVLQNRFAIITGYPGTGKTWTIAEATRHFDEHGISYALCAPTGKAARRITESTGREAKTVHRLLEWGYPQPHSDTPFARNQYNPLDVDVVVCDESSMLDVELAASLMRALGRASLVLVGDVNQLPPVGPGAVLRDLIASDVVPTTFLRELKRAQADTWVYRNAPLILEEGRCELDHDGDDFLFYELDAGSPGMLAPTVVEIVRGLIDQGHSLDDFQVLSPMKARVGGTLPLNEALQRDLNERLGYKPVIERRLGDHTQLLCEGDRVIQTKNDYELWVMNGEVGEVLDVNKDASYARIRFADGERVYKGAQLDALQLAYACTVHKFQGSETDTVIVVAHSSHNRMLTRQLFYTAVTRAKKRVILVGDEPGVQRALRTKRDEYRRTMLRDRVRARAETVL